MCTLLHFVRNAIRFDLLPAVGKVAYFLFLFMAYKFMNLLQRLNMLPRSRKYCFSLYTSALQRQYCQ